MTLDPQMQTPGGNLANANTQPDALDSIATATNRQKETATWIAGLALAGHVVHKGAKGDFMVCKYGLTRNCEDFAELQAFTKQLGVTP